MEIKGKTALVLGASRGIGRSIARTLAQRGARLVLPWYDWPDDVQTMKDEFSSTPTGHILLQIDLRNSTEVLKLMHTIQQKTGRLDILINNIERGGMPIVHGSYNLSVNRDQWQREMETTLHAKWLVFNNCLPLLQQQPQAAVINISSIAAETGRTGTAGLLFNDGYVAANKGIASFTRTWAQIGAPSIRVNEIMLGIFNTRHGPGTRGWDLLTPKEKQRILDHTPMGRTGTPEEVADTVVFLLEKADFMTGATLRLDGGFVLGGEEVPPMPVGVLADTAD